MAVDFLLKAGVVFNPKDIDAVAVSKAVANAVANVTVKLNNFSINRTKLRGQIQDTLDASNFTLNNIIVNATKLDAEIRAALGNAKSVTITPQANMAEATRAIKKAMQDAGKEPAGFRSTVADKKKAALDELRVQWEAIDKLVDQYNAKLARGRANQLIASREGVVPNEGGANIAGAASKKVIESTNKLRMMQTQAELASTSINKLNASYEKGIGPLGKTVSKELSFSDALSKVHEVMSATFAKGLSREPIVKPELLKASAQKLKEVTAEFLKQDAVMKELATTTGYQQKLNYGISAVPQEAVRRSLAGQVEEQKQRLANEKELAKIEMKKRSEIAKQSPDLVAKQKELQALKAQTRESIEGPKATKAPKADEGMIKSNKVAIKTQEELAASVLNTSNKLSHYANVVPQAIRSTDQLNKLYAIGGTNAELFGAKLGQITTRFGEYFIAIRAILAAQALFNDAITTIFDFDSAIQDLNKVLKVTPSQLGNVSKQIFEISQKTGRGFEDVAGSMNQMVRQGLSAEEALERTTTAMIAMNVSEMDQTQATDFLTSAMASYQEELGNTMNALDIISRIADESATNTDELGAAFIRSGASAKAVGISFHELEAIEGAVMAKTRLSAETVGAAFKTIFNTMATGQGAIRAQANAWGANIEAADSILEVFKKLHKIYGSLDKAQRGQLSMLMGGKRRFTELSAVLENFDEVEKLLNISFASSGAAMAKNQMQLDKLSTTVQQVKNYWDQFIATLSGVTEGAKGTGYIRDSLVGAMDAAKWLVGALADVSKFLSGTSVWADYLRSILVGITKGAFFTVGLGIIKGMISGFMRMTQLGSALVSTISNIGMASKNNLSVLSRTQPTLYEILKLKKLIAAQTGKIKQDAEQTLAIYNQQRRASAGAMTPEVKAGMLKITGVMAMMSAIQVAVDQLDELAASLKASEDANERNIGEMVAFGAKTASTTAMFAAMGGPVGALIGLFTSLALKVTSLIASTSKHIHNYEVVSNSLKKFKMSAEQANKAGGYLKEAFDEMSYKYIGHNEFLDTLINAYKKAGDEISGTPATIAKVKDAYNNLTKEVAGIIRSNELAQEMEEFTAGFKQKINELQIKIDTGEVGSEFAPVLENMAKIDELTQRISGGFGGAAEKLRIMQSAEEAVMELGNEHGKTTLQILDSYNLLSAKTQKLESEESRVTAEIQNTLALIDEEKKKILGLDEEMKKLSAKEFQASLAEGVQEYEGYMTDEMKIVQAKMAEVSKQRESSQNRLNQLTQAGTELESKLNDLSSQKTKSVEKDAKVITDIYKFNRSNVDQMKTAVITLQAQTAEMKQQVPLLQKELAFRMQIIKAQLKGVGFGDEVRNQVKEMEHKINVAVDERTRKEANAVKKLYDLRDKAPTLNQAATLEKQIKEYEKAIETNKAEIREKMTLEMAPQLAEAAQADIKKNLAALNAERLSSIQIDLEAEKRYSEERIKFIENYGNTIEGQLALYKEFGNVSQWAADAYGELGARIVEVNTQMAEKSAQAVVDELSTLNRKGIGDEEKLGKYVQARTELIKIAEEDLAQRRETLLKRVDQTAKAVEDAENALIEERNRIPELNERIMAAEEALAQATAQRSQAENDLMNTYQAAADAQARYLYGIDKAIYDVGVATGDISGLGAKISSLAKLYIDVNNEIRMSEEQRLQLQKDIADEMLQTYQQQFESIKNIGIRAATATNDELGKMQKGLFVASSIMRGININRFSSEDLASAMDFSDLIPGLERKIAEQGLAKLGIDPGILESLDQQMLALAKVSAESGKQEVMAANQAVQVAQENLLAQEEVVKTAQSQVAVAIAQRDLQLQAVSTAFSNLQIATSAYVEQQQFASQELKIMDEQLISSRSIEEKLGYVNDGITILAEKLSGANDFNQKILDWADAISKGTAAAIPTSAKGSLSPVEFRSLASAARREKMAMPPGSKLMMANTSEVVLNRRQANTLGLRPIPRQFAATGNAVQTDNNAVALSNAINALLTKLNSPGFVQQNVNVTVDTERKIAVTGLDAVDQAVKNALEDKFGNTATKEEQSAIKDAVVSIVGKLQEYGIVNSMGR